MENRKDQTASLPKIAATSAKKVAVGVILTVSVLGAIGFIVDSWHSITPEFRSAWDGLMFACSFGGHFWGAIALGGTGLAVAAWAIVVKAGLPPCTDGGLRPLHNWLDRVLEAGTG